MKKGLIFLSGMIIGGILTFVSLAVLSKVYQNNDTTGITMAEQQIEFTTAKRFEVFQVLEDGVLANCEENNYSVSLFTGPVVYIVTDGQNLFYDDQIIETPRGKKTIQIGTYRYPTKNGEKVVPIITFK